MFASPALKPDIRYQLYDPSSLVVMLYNEKNPMDGFVRILLAFR